MNSTFTKVLCLGHFPNYGRGKWSPNRAMVSLSKGNRSEIEDTEVAELRGQGIKEEGAAWRKSSRNLHRCTLEALSKLYMCKERIFEA